MVAGSRGDGFTGERVCKLEEGLRAQDEGLRAQTLYQSPPMHPDLEVHSGCWVSPGLEGPHWG